ncbi:MAG: hypothetical protein PHW22_01415 [Bacilli bacterium]|nr:hypothetical protein [Bacilli bacterium]
MSEINDEFEQNGFMLVAVILASISISCLVAIIILNIVISRKRNLIYYSTIKNNKNYDEGIKQLSHLLIIPQSKLNQSRTMLFISYALMLQKKFIDAIEQFNEVKEYDLKFKLGYYHSVSASYYKILICYYIENQICLEKELKYFNELSVCMKDTPYNGILNIHNEFMKVHKYWNYLKWAVENYIFDILELSKGFLYFKKI